MATVGRLKQGDLILAGEVDERLPAVTNGLVAHFPFDDTYRGNNHNPILDYSIWKDGQSGAIGTFGLYGGAADNVRVKGTDPWGRPTVLWKCKGANSGIYCNPVSIDNTKLYRFSWWVNRAVNGDGRSYYGCNGYGTVGGVKNLNDTYTTNPYFWNTSQTPTQAELPLNEWILVVAHIFPHTHSGTVKHADSGRYNLAGYHGATNADYKWAPETTTARGRTLSVYQATATNIEHYHSYMRMEVCDGTEPTIAELLTGESNILHPTTMINANANPRGLEVEPATTNLWTGAGGAFSVYNNLSMPVVWTKLSETYMGSEVWRMQMTPTTQAQLDSIRANLWNHGVVGGGLLWKANTKYASSICWRPVNKPDMVFGGTAANVAGFIAGINEPLTNGWIRYYRYRNGLHTTDVSDSVHHSFYCPSLVLNESIYVDFCCAQTEEGKDAPTSFVIGNRAAGSMSIQTDIGLSNFTIFGEFIPNANSDTLPDGSYFLDIGNGMILRTYTQVPYIDGNTIAGAGGNNVHLDFNTSPGIKVSYIIQRNGTTFTWRMKSENGQDVTWTKVHANVASKVLSSLNFHSSWGGVHSNISIYNRALDVNETKKLLNGAFKITKEGNLASEISEKQNGELSGGNFFPLGINAESDWGLIKPSVETNTVYSNGAVWVGGAVTNLYRQAISNEDFPARGSGIFTVRNLGREIEFQYDYSQNLTWTYHGQTAAVVIGTAYRASMDVFISEDANIPSTGTTFVANMEGGCATNFYYDNTKKGTWQHFDNVVTATTTSTNLYLYPSTGTSPATTGYVKYKNVMLTPTSFTHPFVNGTRPLGQINYPTSLITGSVNLAFSLWAKTDAFENEYNMPMDCYPHVYVSMRQAKYLHFSFTNNGTQASITGGTLVPGRWHHIAGIKTATSFKMFLDGKLLATHTATGTGYTATTSRFHLGSYGTSYPLNGYIRDFMFESGTITLTDAKILEIYKTQLRTSNNNGITAQGELKEGKVF